MRLAVAADKFLVYNVKQRWTPLCEFLEIDKKICPQYEFPKKNDGATFRAVTDRYRKEQRLLARKAFLHIIAILMGAVGVIWGVIYSDRFPW